MTGICLQWRGSEIRAACYQLQFWRITVNKVTNAFLALYVATLAAGSACGPSTPPIAQQKVSSVTIAQYEAMGPDDRASYETAAFVVAIQDLRDANRNDLADAALAYLKDSSGTMKLADGSQAHVSQALLDFQANLGPIGDQQGLSTPVNKVVRVTLDGYFAQNLHITGKVPPSFDTQVFDPAQVLGLKH